MALNIVILAAGKGKRMQSALPKVLHLLAGKPLLAHVVDTARKLTEDELYVVYGNGGNDVKTTLSYLNVQWVEQTESIGTGHAVLQAIPKIADNAKVLVLYGDVPLVSEKTLKTLVDTTPSNTLGLITIEVEDPTGYGRIIRDAKGDIQGIVEHKDADNDQRNIKEINSGIIAVDASHLKKWLPMLNNKNGQGEYYLTDIVSMAISENIPVKSITVKNAKEVLGVNTRTDLVNLERFYQKQRAEQLMSQGITLMDPSRFDLRGDLIASKDVVIDVNVIMEGKVTIGANSIIGPNVILKDVEIGENVEIKANSMIENAKLSANCTVGPFARIRPGTTIKAGAKIGNFVEVKNSEIGEDSKVNHLSYIGDATLGRGVNIGAGTITCNYDGANKHKTIIKDNVFVGSNTQFVAPVTIGENATIGAGSTITSDVPAENLALSRAKQKTVSDWKRPTKSSTVIPAKAGVQELKKQ